MWREGALGPAINIVASLCADVRFFGSALRMGVPSAGCLFLLGADWSRWSVAFGALSHNCVGGSWAVHSRHGGLLCSLPAAPMQPPFTQLCWGRGRAAFRCGFSERWRGHLMGRIEPCGGDAGRGLRCCFGMLRGANGMTAGWCLLSFAP
jgi:hypothetical protein